MGRIKKLTQRQKQQLKKRYYDPTTPGSFSGANSFIKANPKIPKQLIKEWLKTQRAYTLHVPIVKKFQRRRVICGPIFKQLEIDLIDMQSLSNANKKVKYILTAIDCLSKKGFARVLTNKKATTTSDALESILDEINKKVSVIHSDEGPEFMAKTVKAMLKKRSISIFSTFNKDLKGTIIERFNETLQHKLYTYMTAFHTDKWIDVLQPIVNSYNNTYHSTIKMAPADVNNKSAELVWLNTYNPQIKKTKAKFKEGDIVRIQKIDKKFKKGYISGWKEKLFTVVKKLNTIPWTYKIADEEGSYEGSFYEREMSSAIDTKLYVPEKVIKERTRKGVKEVLVKWLGYDDTYNSWEKRKTILGA